MPQFSQVYSDWWTPDRITNAHYAFQTSASRWKPSFDSPLCICVSGQARRLHELCQMRRIKWWYYLSYPIRSVMFRCPSLWLCNLIHSSVWVRIVFGSARTRIRSSSTSGHAMCSGRQSDYDRGFSHFILCQMTYFWVESSTFQTARTLRKNGFFIAPERDPLGAELPMLIFPKHYHLLGVR
jgi:hypothetical protein